VLYQFHLHGQSWRIENSSGPSLLSLLKIDRNKTDMGIHRTTIHMKACFFCLILGVSWLARPVPTAGASLCLYASGAPSSAVQLNANLFPCNEAATASSPALTGSQTVAAPNNFGSGGGGSNASANYSTSLSYAALGLSAGFSAYNLTASGNAGDYSGLDLTADASDYLTFTGVTNGTLALSFSVKGTLSGSGDNGNDTLSAVYTLEENTGSFEVEAAGSLLSAGASTPGSYASTGSTMNFSFTKDQSNASLWDYFATGTVLLPFGSGGFALHEDLEIDGRCVDAYSGCSYSADLLDPAMVGGAVIYDSNGDVVQGATVVSQSGFDYTQALPSSAIPEPGTFGMVVVGAFAALALLQRRRCTD
jgi:hypothetical protein